MVEADAYLFEKKCQFGRSQDPSRSISRHCFYQIIIDSVIEEPQYYFVAVPRGCLVVAQRTFGSASNLPCETF